MKKELRIYGMGNHYFSDKNLLTIYFGKKFIHFYYRKKIKIFKNELSINSHPFWFFGFTNCVEPE